jgi:[protein-PII] uridylyltransferase
MADLSVLRDQYRQEKQALWAHIANSSASGRGLKRSLGRLARLADVLLSHLWHNAGFEHGEALIAVGGYGRGELFPSSDVDVLVLLPDGANTDDSSDLKSKIEAFIGSCWDSGLEIGSSVRTLQDCLLESEKDITIQTSLLESRYITGSQKLYRQFTSSYDKAMDPQAFFVAKTLEMQQRHNKFENTPYALEPNCKESPGGLSLIHI